MLKLEDLDLDMIAMAMQDDGSLGVEYYLNTLTGELVMAGLDDDDLEVDSEELEDEKYAGVDRIESYESYQHMEDFTRSLAEGKARAELEQALIRHKPFRHFKDVLGFFPEEREAWYRFKDEAMRRVVIEWLVGIEAVEDPDPAGTRENQE